jgi:hypothetical protein
LDFAMKGKRRNRERGQSQRCLQGFRCDQLGRLQFIRRFEVEHVFRKEDWEFGLALLCLRCLVEARCSGSYL